MDESFSVLVVDDERGMREGCRRILERHAALVDTAESGDEAVAKFARRHYDLALVDIRMPGMDGMETLDRLRALDPDAVTIMVTGYASLQTAIEATKRGAHDVLPKPFTPDQLLAKVFSAVERRQLTLEAKRLREERERRLLEIATEKSRLRTVINCMQDGVLVTNRDGDVVLSNPAATRLLLLDDSRLLEHNVADAARQAELVDMIEKVLREGDGVSMLAREIAVERENRVLMANVAPVRDENGERLGAVAVLRDITQLKELDRAKSQFVSMVSHELRAPLAVIEGYLGMVLGGMATDDPVEERLILSRSRARAQSLLTLIDDLLDISRIEAGQLAKRVETLDPAEICRDVLGLLRPQAAARGIVLREESAGDLPRIQADREDVVRVLTNLVSNAIKYNRDEGQVVVRSSIEGGYLRLDVVDTGLGIAAEDTSKIFDEFYRVKRRETREITGTGLGLAIAKRIVDSYNGVVKVASELGKGSTFSVFLPLGDIANMRNAIE